MRLGFPPLIEAFGARRLATAALDLLLPPGCLLCPVPVDAPGLLCGGCFGQLTLIGAPCCACCGRPFELAWRAAESGLCARCAEMPPPFEHARAALIYDRVSRRLLLPFKHADRIELSLLLIRLMAQAGAALLRGADVLVPVPLHRRRLFVRKYNQAALLARGLGRLADRPVAVDGLARVRATRSLGHKSAAERREEVEGAFSVRPGRISAIAGRRVLLIDDVMTSGATAAACANVLLEAGAKAVDVLVAAWVPEPARQVPRGRRQMGWRRNDTRVSPPAIRAGDL